MHMYLKPPSGIDYEPIRDVNPTTSFTKVFKFSSVRKSTSTVLPLPGGGWRLLTKGASKNVLGKCSRIIAENGRVQPLTDEEKEELEVNVMQPMAKHALRTICLAYRYIIHSLSPPPPLLVNFSFSTISPLFPPPVHIHVPAIYAHTHTHTHTHTRTGTSPLCPRRTQRSHKR